MAGTRWSLNPLVALHWRRWDDGWVLFEEGSGSTHRMDDFAAAILRTLAEHGPLEEERLADHLLVELDVSAKPAERTGVGELLSQFGRLGIAESL